MKKQNRLDRQDIRFFRTLHALTIDHRRCRTSRSSVQFHGIPHTVCDELDPACRIVIPAVKVTMDRAAWRKVLRDVAPLAAGAEYIHQTVQNLADVHGALVAASFGGRDQRFDRRPFLVGEVMTVAQASTIVPAAAFCCPHWAPPESVPPIESQSIRAWQARPKAADSKDSVCDKH